jgi:hypothetical protein
MPQFLLNKRKQASLRLMLCGIGLRLAQFPHSVGACVGHRISRIAKPSSIQNGCRFLNSRVERVGARLAGREPATVGGRSPLVPRGCV